MSLSASIPPPLLVMTVEQLLHAVFHVCIVAQKHDIVSVIFCIATGVAALSWLSSDVTEMHMRALTFRISAFMITCFIIIILTYRFVLANQDETTCLASDLRSPS